jgi:8-oxo-dGTP pyrophosphatase MutT (NUDIX family)
MEKQVYKGQIIKVTEEVIGGINWERVYLPSGVIVFPLNEKGQVLMVEEKRPHETPPVRIKPVSGILEVDKGSPTENAQREMQEEIGFKADKMENYWTMKSSGTVNSQQHFFVARDLSASKLPNPDGEDTIMSVKAFDLEELKEMYLRDELHWSMSTLGFFRLLQHLGK